MLHAGKPSPRGRTNDYSDFGRPKRMVLSRAPSLTMIVIPSGRLSPWCRMKHPPARNTRSGTMARASFVLTWMLVAASHRLDLKDRPPIEIKSLCNGRCSKPNQFPPLHRL